MDECDFWDMTNLAAADDPWRVAYSEHWSGKQCGVRYDAEAEIAEVIAPLVSRLRGQETPVAEANWIAESEARRVVRAALKRAQASRPRERVV